MPLKFEPVYKEYLWGGERIARNYRRQGVPAVCAESWEVSAHRDGESLVATGPHSGRSLAELTREYGSALLGRAAADSTAFPLLCKIIDARDLLSVQVHPNSSNAKLTGGAPKTEAWVVLAATDEAQLYAGFKPGVTPATLRRAVAEGSVAECLNALPVKAGEALFVPGGLVHAIGRGCLIYEVQQSSNTTWRLFDWNRRDARGRARELHIEESFKSIDWGLAAPTLRGGVTAATHAIDGAPQWRSLAQCEHFTVRGLDFTGTVVQRLDGTTCHILFVAQGEVSLESGAEQVHLRAGDSLMIPAAVSTYRLSAAAPASLIVTTLNQEREGDG